jgi:hypothetical protein
MAEEVRTHFAGFDFGAPCSEADIRSAEAALGEELPAVLRELYLAFDGFLGPTNAGFFWRLFDPDPDAGGLVETNRFFRQGEEFPREFVSRCVFFGDNGCGPQWGIKKDLPGKVIMWDAAWGDRFQVVGENPLEAWLAEKRAYDELDERRHT